MRFAAAVLALLGAAAAAVDEVVATPCFFEHQAKGRSARLASVARARKAHVMLFGA